MLKVRKCPNCGASVPWDKLKCDYCDSWFEQVPNFGGFKWSDYPTIEEIVTNPNIVWTSNTSVTTSTLMATGCCYGPITVNYDLLRRK